MRWSPFVDGEVCGQCADKRSPGSSREVAWLKARTKQDGAVQYTGMYELAGWLPEQAPGSLADHVIDDLAELPAVLGLT